MSRTIAVTLAALVVGCQITIADETSKSDGGSCTRCGTDECFDLVTDPAHCGSCGASCGSGQACVGGSCTSDFCPRGMVDCSSTSPRMPEPECVHLASNMAHCGLCGSVCAASSAGDTPVCTPDGCRVGVQGEPYFAAGDALTLDSVVRIYDDAGESHTLCFAGFDEIAGEIICRFFGLTYASHHASARPSAEGIGMLACTGAESVLTDCSYVVGPCATEELVRLICAVP